MVKTKALFLAVLVILVCSCAPGGPLAAARPQVLELARGRLGRTVSLVRAADSLIAVYSNWETTSLYAAQVPISDHLPDTVPPAQLIDKIDTTPPLAPSFGEHASIGRGDSVTILYLARRGEDKLVLKLASREAGSQEWNVDVIEPPGNPLAIVPSDGDRLDLVWAAGSLLSLSYPGSPPPVPLLSPFIPESRASVVESAAAESPDRPAGARFPSSLPPGATRGFTVYDALSRALLFFRWNGASYDRSVVEGAGPVHSSLALDDGSLAVFSWDERSKRLQLFETRQGMPAPTRKTVSLSEATTAVALLADGPGASGASGGGVAPAPAAGNRRSPLLFLYDEGRRTGGGGVIHELSLLTPGPALGRGYTKTVLASGEQPIADFSALETSGALYVLLLQGSLKLLRVPLS